MGRSLPQGDALPQSHGLPVEHVGGHSGSLGQHDSTSSQGSGGQRLMDQPEQPMTEQELRMERTKQKNKRAQKKFRRVSAS